MIRLRHTYAMSAITFLEKVEAKRKEHLESLAKVPDGDSHAHARSKGHMQGLVEALGIFRKELQIDDEER